MAFLYWKMKALRNKVVSLLSLIPENNYLIPLVLNIITFNFESIRHFYVLFFLHNVCFLLSLNVNVFVRIFTKLYTSYTFLDLPVFRKCLLEIG